MSARPSTDAIGASPDAEPPAFAHDTWNTPEWIARHREMTPGARFELAVEVSRAALQFAHARRVRPDER